MMYEVRIDIPALFAECMDQTLIDYRNRVNERGQDMAEAETLEPSLRDIFTVNLRSVASALQLVLRRDVGGMLDEFFRGDLPAAGYIGFAARHRGRDDKGRT